MTSLPSILIVDDEQENLDSLHRLLRKDFQVTTTSSALEAIKILQTTSFAVILCDQRMPELTGVELLEKASQLSPDSTRVLITGYTDFDAIVDAINRGHIYHYVAKPWDPNNLLNLLLKASEHYSLKKEIQEKSLALQKSNQALKESFEKLSTLDKAKDRFLSLVSHELNTPLTVLNSFLEMFKTSSSGQSQEATTLVEKMELATDRLSQIVKEIVEFVRLETDEFHFKPLRLCKVVDLVIQTMGPLTQSKQLEIDWTYDKLLEEKQVIADEPHLHKGIEALLVDNIQRAQPSSTIEVKMVEKQGFVGVQVSRSGELITQEALSALDPTLSIEHHKKGLGLSLAMSKRIAEKVGGQLDLKLSTLDKTVLLLWLPLHKPV